MKTVLKLLFWIVVLIVLLFVSFLLYITLTDFKPDKIEKLVENPNVNPISQDTFNLMIWNIGYAGLGGEMDFFYDDGKQVRPSKELSRKYLDGIKSFITNQKQIDFWLFQEVDIEARRSYYKNEVEEIRHAEPDFHDVFTINYQVPFVPVPVYEPMGYVKGGMLSLSVPEPSVAERHAYPLIASWPNKLFLLDRCFILMRFPLDDGKDLVVLNTHNSAYVYDSVLRLKELQIIKDKMLEEFDKGNYVISGGDWNANPPYFQPTNNFNGQVFEPSVVKMNPDLLPENWTWAFDPSAPTNRKNYKPFVKGENETTYLDYFVVSPNVDVLQIKTIDLNFENSDHNPVYLQVRLIK